MFYYKTAPSFKGMVFICTKLQEQGIIGAGERRNC